MDTNFTPFGESRRQAILDAVVQEGDAAESAALEIKSDLDLTKKGVGTAKVAKFILGMANRTTESASRHFNGYGVLVVGAQKGQALGVAPGVEAHELGDLLRPYLGEDGPAWDLDRLALLDGREVLFIIVAPPAPGQPLYPCCKDFQPSEKSDAKSSLADGDIYVRDKTQTRKARSSELIALSRRLVATERDSVEVSVDLEGTALCVKDSTSVLDRWADHHARKTRQEVAVRQDDDSEEPGLSPLLGTRNLLIRSLNLPPERPSDPEEGIRRRVVEVRGRWPECRDVLYSVTATPVMVRVTTPTYLRNPQVVLKFHGTRGLTPENAEDVEEHEALPFVFPPRDPLGYSVPTLNYRSLRPANPEVSWDDEDEGVRLVLTPEALRPSTTWRMDADELVLICLDADVESVPVEWSLTAEGLSTRIDGTAQMPVRRVDDVVELMREFAQRTKR